MSFLSFGKSTAEKVPPARKQAGLIGSIAARKVPGASVETLSPRLGTQEVIKTMDRFPHRQDVISGPRATTPNLIVPEAHQDKVMMVRIDAMNAVLAYDPAFTAYVKPYFSALRTGATGQGLSVSADSLLVETGVLKAVREAAESQRGLAGIVGSASSNGAKLFKEWAQAANEAGATDLHMTVINGGRGLVQCRVDGELDPIFTEGKGIFTDRDVKIAMKSAYEDMAEVHSNNEGTFSDLKPMSCMVADRLGIPNIRLRVSSHKGFFGPRSVSRLLHSELNVEPMSYTSMGLAMSHIDMLQKAQRLKSGAVIQVGVTGSGKTTVAKTFIETHPMNGRAAFYGIADPIEYLLRNTHQIYIQRSLMDLNDGKKKDPYSETIEQLMRMDPDLVDVGEVRDQISARALANVAKTGHLAMGTLHAPSIGEVISRLIDPKMGFSREELTSGKMLSFISYQALLPLLCTCAVDMETAIQQHKSGEEEHEGRYIGTLMRTINTKLGFDSSIFKFKNKDGCVLCKKRGTKGLTMAAEMMMPDEEWLDLSAGGNDRGAIRNWRQRYSDKRLDSPNMDGKLIVEHALYKAITGRIDPRCLETWGPLDQLEILKP